MRLRTVAVLLLAAFVVASAAVGEEGAPAADKYYQAGLKLKEQGKTDEAIAELEKAVAADPNKTGPHWVLGWLYAKKKEKEKAVAEFSKYVELAPDSPNAQKAKDAIGRLGATAAPPAPGAAPTTPTPPTAKPAPTPPAAKKPGPAGAGTLPPMPTPGEAAGAEEGGGPLSSLPLPLPALIGIVVGVVLLIVVIVIVKKKKAAAGAPAAAPEAAVPEAPAEQAPPAEPAAAPATPEAGPAAATTVNMQFRIEGPTPQDGAIENIAAFVDATTRQLNLVNPADNTTQSLPLDEIGDCRFDRDAGGPYISIAMRDAQRHYWLRGDEGQLNALYAHITS